MKALAALNSGINATDFHSQLISFLEVIEEARPEEMQRLIRLLVRKIEWMPESESRARFYVWPKTKNGLHPLNPGKQPTSEGFATNVHNGSP